MNNMLLIKNILNRDDSFIKVLEYGTESEIIELINKLSNIEIDEFIVNCQSNLKLFKSSEVIMFSNYNEVFNLVKILIFNKNLSFKEIGNKLTGSKSDIACLKYGENHSKLAAEMHLVKIDHSVRPYRVNITNFGELVARNKIDKIQKVLLIILLGNRVIQSMISDLLEKDIFYKEYVSNLSYSTQIRRRSNIKYIVDRIIEISSIKNSVEWEV